MGRRVLVAILIAGGMAAALPLLAQEGHPLVGTWHGEWHPAAGQRSPVVMFMKWDTKNITGVINPGPRSMALKTATLDASQWAVHFEADGKDQGGNAIRVVIDGKLDNIGSFNRTITGTWTQGTTKGDFKITRD